MEILHSRGRAEVNVSKGNGICFTVVVKEKLSQKSSAIYKHFFIYIWRITEFNAQIVDIGGFSGQTQYVNFQNFGCYTHL